MTKRLLSLLLALALLCAALPAWAEAAAPSVAGTWLLCRLTVGSRVVEDPAAMGISKVLVFNADGSAQVTINDTVYGASWTQEGETLRLRYEDGDQAVFVPEGERLVYEVGDQVQVFAKMVFTAPQADSPLGRWQAYALNTNGVVTLADDSGALTEQLFFYPDGSGVSLFVGSDVRYSFFSWFQQQEQVTAVLADGGTRALRLENGELRAGITPQVYLAPAAWLAEDAQPVVALSAQEFLGEWRLCAFDATALGYAHLFPEEMFSMDCRLTVDAESVALTTRVKGQQTDSVTRWSAAFESGALCLPPDQSLRLYENGWVSLVISDASVGDVPLFFKRAAE